MKLIRPCIEFKDQVMAYKEDFIKHDDNLAGTSYLRDYEIYEDWMKFVLENEREETKHTEVTATVFLAVDDENQVLGFTNIRHALNDYLFNFGGHIGYSVKRDQRGKGYAKEILRLTLDECRRLGLDKVLITCDASNVASAKTIKGHGGVLENEVEEDGAVVQRYWVDLKK